MATIEVAPGFEMSEKGNISLPAVFLPSFRAQLAVHRKVQNDFLIYVCGGLGDAICAEPAIRYAISTFKGAKFTVATYWPQIYRHLGLEKIINFFEDPKGSNEYFNEYFVFKSLFNSDELHSEFIPHMFTHVIDYHSLTMFRTQMEPRQKRIVLKPTYTEQATVHNTEEAILIHPGRTWQSRTMPATWWDGVTAELIKRGIKPYIIGRTTEDPKLGTVDVNTTGCVDLRNKLSIMDTVALTQIAKVVLTNDSSPLHMAASGDSAWIGFMSTVKRPDLLMHYRGPNNECGWKMENLALGGMWQHMNMNPNNGAQFYFDRVEEKLLMQWLPDPREVAAWAIEKKLKG